MKVRFFGPPAKPGYSGLHSIEMELRMRLDTGDDSDVDVCLYPCTQAPPMDRPTALICHDPRQWMHAQDFRRIYERAAAIIGTAPGDQFIALPKGQRLGGMSELVQRIRSLYSASPVRHLFGLYSLGCGGVERGVSDWLSELAEDVRRSVMVLGRKSVKVRIPWPDGLQLSEPGDILSFVRAHLSTLKTVWVQPLQCPDPEALLALCKAHGVACYWLLVSDLPAIMAECRAAAAAGANIVATSEPLLDVAKSMGKSVLVSHFIDPVPVRTGKRGKTLGYVGRISPEKGVMRIPGALSYLPSHRLRICAPSASAASDTYRQEMETELAISKVADRTEWMLDELDRAKLYDGIDTLLLLSDGEGWSLVAHEALSAGITVVASHHLSICGEGHPGVFPCDPEERASIVRAIKAAGKPTFAAVAKASNGHTRETWRAASLPDFERLMGGGEPAVPFDRWLGPERWVSLASIPSRVDLLAKTVASLLPQVDRLNVYLNGYDAVPDFLLGNPMIHVTTSQEHGDRGDAGKFHWVSECTGYYLTADDDIIYPPDYVATLVDAIEDRGRMAVVGFHGNVLPEEFESYYKDRVNYRFGVGLAEDVPVDVLGTGVCGFHASTLALTPEDFEKPNMADIWLCKQARKQGVPLVCLTHKGGWVVPQKVPAGIYEANRRDPEDQDSVLREIGGFGNPKDVPTATAGSLACPDPCVLSTIIPSYRTRPEWLREAVASVLAQPLPDGWRHEVWVGFDGCDPIDLPAGVGVVVSDRNHGPYVMANLLAALASGEYISRVDADDTVHPERAMRLLSICGECGMAGSEWADSSAPNVRHRRATEGAWLWHRDALRRIGGFAPWRCAADTDSLARAEAGGIVRAIDRRPSYLYRQHDEQLTRSQTTAFGSPIRQYYRARIKGVRPVAVAPYLPLRYTVITRP